MSHLEIVTWSLLGFAGVCVAVMVYDLFVDRHRPEDEERSR